MSSGYPRRQVLAAGFAAGAVASLGRTSAAEARYGGAATVALCGITVIDVTGTPLRSGMTVIVRGGRIVEIGRSREVGVPRGARVLDGTGKFLIPGLCDMHVHSVDTELDQIYAPLYLVNGVTTVREMAGTPYLHEFRQRVESGDALGPRSVIASPLIDGAPSLWANLGYAAYIEVADESEARQAVRRVKGEGADFVKVYTRLSRPSFHAVADEARRLGIPFAGHCPDVVPVTEAARAGQRSIEHTWGVWYSTSNREAEVRRALAEIRIDGGDYNNWFNQVHPVDWMATRSHDPRKADGVYAQFAAMRTRQVPTLVAMRVVAMPDDVSPADDRLRYMPTSTHEVWNWQLEETFKAGRTPEVAAQHRELFEDRLRMVKRMHRSGVPILAGTDTSNPYAFPGFALHDELALLVRAGLTPMQALRAATVEAATFLGRADRIGAIREGHLADLVVLDGNPLEDIRHTGAVHAVLARGRLISADDRQRMLAAVEEAARTMPAARGGGGCACGSGISVNAGVAPA